MVFFTDPNTKFDELELYKRKNVYFWLILLHVIQNSTARAILNKLKCDEPDAWAAFLTIDERIREGLLQIYSVSTALGELDALNIQTFTGLSGLSLFLL